MQNSSIKFSSSFASAFRYFFWFDSIPIYRQHFSNSSSMLLAYTFYSFSTFFLNIIQFIKFPLQNYLSINFFLYSVIIAHDKLLLKEFYFNPTTKTKIYTVIIICNLNMIFLILPFLYIWSWLPPPFLKVF